VRACISLYFSVRLSLSLSLSLSVSLRSLNSLSSPFRPLSKATQWFLNKPDKNLALLPEDEQRAETIRGWFHTLVTFDKSQSKYIPAALLRFQSSMERRSALVAAVGRFKIFLAGFDAPSLASKQPKQIEALVRELATVQMLTKHGVSPELKTVIDSGVEILESLRSLTTSRLLVAIEEMRFESAIEILDNARLYVTTDTSSDMRACVNCGKAIHALRGTRMGEHPADHESGFILAEGTFHAYSNASLFIDTGLKRPHATTEVKVHDVRFVALFDAFSISFASQSEAFSKWLCALQAICKQPDFALLADGVAMDDVNLASSRARYEAWYLKVERILTITDNMHVKSFDEDLAIPAVYREATLVRKLFNAAMVRAGDCNQADITVAIPNAAFSDFSSLATFVWVGGGGGSTISFHKGAFLGIDLQKGLSKSLSGVMQLFAPGLPIDAHATLARLSDILAFDEAVSKPKNESYCKSCLEFCSALHKVVSDDMEAAIHTLNSLAALGKPSDGWGSAEALAAQINDVGLVCCPAVLAVVKHMDAAFEKELAENIESALDRFSSFVDVVNGADLIMPLGCCIDGKRMNLKTEMEHMVGIVRAEHTAYLAVKAACALLRPLLSKYIETGEALSLDDNSRAMKALGDNYHASFSPESEPPNRFFNALAYIASVLVAEGSASQCY
jgi:hypothetical protein